MHEKGEQKQYVQIQYCVTLSQNSHDIADAEYIMAYNMQLIVCVLNWLYNVLIYIFIVNYIYSETMLSHDLLSVYGTICHESRVGLSL